MTIPKFIHLYRKLIEIPSVSSTSSHWDMGNKEIIEQLAHWCQDLGFSVEIDDIRAGKKNLLAKLGHGEGGLLLSGHSDTVPFDEGRWNFNPYQLTESQGRFYGLGTADMKGFFAFVLEAVRNIDWKNQQKPLYILATCDEETSMLGARHFKEHTNISPDYCIIGEPTNLKPIRAHKGHLSNSIRVTGKSGHSSNPALGINAIEIMNEILFALIQLKEALISKYHHPGFQIPQPTLNLGHIHGGDSPNRICGCCELHFDIRPLPQMSLSSLNQLIQSKLEPIQKKWPNLIEIKALHEPIPGYECPPENEFNQSIEKLLKQTPETVNYCTEAPFLNQICPTLVLGPGSIEQAHQPDEFLSLKTVQPTIEILTKLIQNYCFNPVKD